MQSINDFLVILDGYLGGHPWFMVLLIGTGVFFTFYLGFPQLKYFSHAIRITLGKYDHSQDVGDTSHFQALATALSGTVGTGNIAGVALAIHTGGPAALFWMLITAFIGMCTKMVEVSISHKYRDILPDGTVSGGPMYYMKKRLNITTRKGKVIRIGSVMGAFFAAATMLCSFSTGSLPQINSISNSVFATFGIDHIITGAILSFLLGLVIIGGIKRIAKVTSILVPFMALLYFLGSLAVILSNPANILPSLASIARDAFSGSAASGGFLGASFAFAMNRGVNRGLFSNEAGQGSAPIAHSAARAPEPVSEGIVALLEPFIDTICICTLTGLVLLASGAWNTKTDNQFQLTDVQVLSGNYDDNKAQDAQRLGLHIRGIKPIEPYSGVLQVKNGMIQPTGITLLHARSVAENVRVLTNKMPYSGTLDVDSGKLMLPSTTVLRGNSLVHSAPLTTFAFTRSILKGFGAYIVTFSLLLFAFSTAISWSYYGDRATTYLFGYKYVLPFRLVFVAAFFVASFTDTTVVWSLAYVAIVLMAVPNLVGILLLRKEMKTAVAEYWQTFSIQYPNDKMSIKMRKHFRRER
ncbi:MAG TPA: sodium:alanine symporter family protein [Polyangiaceae bacterium]|jgi:AGCS family alanine or glycine:cation symporter|nr:MAG: Amino-acid carrier protein AlsT [Deltaproteobacteria bacterium ADurb.Bin207]HNS97838.1 sodium:alanine symporter family protein [Polyangiaceae bacterium]HNZ20554.1 sodium:alanine symporter family protein [Polyangiaceae bacterium]HOD20830.1 sodium:alanine symporter family protein [Polyangiaceae bacterium]HOE47250.1 sodium:alanine symporter family protein [Polyangiaceae bacterium]